METFMDQVIKTIRRNQIISGNLARGEKPINVIMYSRIDRVPVRKNPLIKYSTGQLTTELVRRRAITLSALEV